MSRSHTRIRRRHRRLLPASYGKSQAGVAMTRRHLLHAQLEYTKPCVSARTCIRMPVELHSKFASSTMSFCNRGVVSHVGACGKTCLGNG